MQVHGCMVGMCVFHMYKYVFMHLCTIYVCTVYITCVYIYRCYYRVYALSGIGDESLEFNLCHKHTGHT